MVNIETTAAELRAVAAGVDAAANDASGAAAKAGDVAARATASGFAGVAQGMQRVQTLIQEAVSPLRTAGERCREAAGPVAEAPKGASTQQAIEGLAAATAKADAAFEAVSAGIHKIEEAQRLAAAVLQGGQPGPLLAMLGEIKKRLVDMIQHAAKAKQDLGVAIAEAKQTGRFGQQGT